MRLVCCLVLLLGGLQLASALLVAAWNIQTFGKSKANLLKPSKTKAGILNYIAEIVRQYDVVVIQEVHDPDLAVINALMNAINGQGPPAYDHIQSEPLGGSGERYLYVYKTSTVTHNKNRDSYQYPNINNVFVRPPFAAKFTKIRVAGQTSYDFVMIPLHATPGPEDETVAEINALHDVAQALPPALTTPNKLLLGDFNAGGTYLPRGETTPGLTLPGYAWLIRDGVCTNLAKTTSCTYDRIVATTAMLTHVARNTGAAAVPYKAEPYDFVRAGGLPPGAIRNPSKISDHFPVMVQLL